MKILDPVSRTEDGAVASSDDAAGRRLLEAISDVSKRQREAILARDVHALGRLFDALLQLHADLSSLVAGLPAKKQLEQQDALATLARQVREELWVNRVLFANGIIIADHLMATAMNAAASSALFSGVA